MRIFYIFRNLIIILSIESWEFQVIWKHKEITKRTIVILFFLNLRHHNKIKPSKAEFFFGNCQTGMIKRLSCLRLMTMKPEVWNALELLLSKRHLPCNQPALARDSFYLIKVRSLLFSICCLIFAFLDLFFSYNLKWNWRNSILRNFYFNSKHRKLYYEVKCRNLSIYLYREIAITSWKTEKDFWQTID